MSRPVVLTRFYVNFLNRIWSYQVLTEKRKKGVKIFLEGHI